MNIRTFRPGDEKALLNVFLSSVHDIAIQDYTTEQIQDYTTEQIQAWAPSSLDPDLWAEHMRHIAPFVAEDTVGNILGYADLQKNGYIDHFFVSGIFSRQGVGTALMAHIVKMAHGMKFDDLSSLVSLTAQPFFQKFGFALAEQRLSDRRGVLISNALMKRKLSI